MPAPHRPIVPETHFARFENWLAMEGEAERERLVERRQVQSSADAEAGGETLLDMVMASHASGLGGRYLVTFRKRRTRDRLPWHRFKVGSPVMLSPRDAGRPLPGIVSSRRNDSLEIAVDHWPEGDRFRIDMTPDEVTRKRQLSAMQEAAIATGRHGQLRDLLLYHRAPTFRPQPALERPKRLNESQWQAVQFSMSANDLAVIHGPPGTGKTTTVVEVIRQAIAAGERVLACAPSNTAVDNLLEKLVESGVDGVRLGHPARVLKGVRSHTLDARVQHHPAQGVIADMLREADQLEQRSSRYTRVRPPRGHKSRQRQEARALRRQARTMERKAVADVLSGAQAICATVSFDFGLLEGERFDLLVIDEACQSVEPGCWVPLRFARRLVLAGDHCQLPPAILSQAAAREGFGVSLMERLVDALGPSITSQLTVQYRMHQQIMEFSSDAFYDGKLTAHCSVADHRLPDLPSVDGGAVDDRPVLFLDTAGVGWEEELEPGGLSRLNPGEGRLVLDQVTTLCDAGVHPRDIAVIAPYAAQVRWLRHHAEQEQLEVDTVDGFQGREKEAVVISTVRSNRDGEIGFLADERRMNVALTRAKRKLIVIGDSATLGTSDFFQKLLAWFDSIGAYRSAWEIGLDD